MDPLVVMVQYTPITSEHPMFLNPCFQAYSLGNLHVYVCIRYDLGSGWLLWVLSYAEKYLGTVAFGSLNFAILTRDELFGRFLYLFMDTYFARVAIT